MSNTEWRSGDVFDAHGTRGFVSHGRDSGHVYKRVHYETGVTAPAPPHQARRLVVIDPEDREQVERLTVLVKENRAGLAVDEGTVAAALREFANPKPPKPEEPTGLGAVVETSTGKRYVRHHPWAGRFTPWYAEDGTDWYWGELDVVKVLSEGVTDDS